MTHERPLAWVMLASWSSEGLLLSEAEASGLLLGFVPEDLEVVGLAVEGE